MNKVREEVEKKKRKIMSMREKRKGFERIEIGEEDYIKLKVEIVDKRDIEKEKGQEEVNKGVMIEEEKIRKRKI